MCTSTCSCISCTVVFGQQLVDLCHVWIELNYKTDGALATIITNVAGCISALSQLRPLLEDNKASHARIFTPAGHQDIERLSLKCNIISKAVILLVQKAADRKNKSSDHQGRQEDGAWPDPVEDTSNLLTGEVPSLRSTKTLGLIRQLSGQWYWLENRTDHCLTQIQWVRKSLLLHLQMGRLTMQSNLGTIDSGDSIFESQAILRASVRGLWQSQLKFVKSKARKQERAEQRVQRLQDARDKADSTSIHSSSSRDSVSTGTVCVDEDDDTKSTGDKEQPEVVLSISSVPDPAISESLTKPEEKTSGKLSTAKHELRTSISQTMSQWGHKIFGEEDQFDKDWQSKNLEAWVIRSSPPFMDPLKLPFGHQRLQYGLKKINGKKAHKMGLTTFSRYMDEGPRVHVLVDEIVREANRLQNRERVCLSFGEYKHSEDDGDWSFLIAFLSICEEKAPISFKDCFGRKMTLPFEICRTWEGMQSLINEAFRHMSGIGPHVMEEHYELRSSKDEIILPALWENTVKPGDSIVMKTWPVHEHALRQWHPQAPFVPPLRGASDQLAASLRASRLRHMHHGHSPGRPHPVSSGFPRPYLPGPPGVVPGQRPFGGPMGRPVPRAASTVTSINEDELQEAEKKELTFVNFVEELEKIKGVTGADLLAKFTELRDNSGCLIDDEYYPTSDTGSDCDSDSSGSSSSSTRSIVDD